MCMLLLGFSLPSLHTLHLGRITTIRRMVPPVQTLSRTSTEFNFFPLDCSFKVFLNFILGIETSGEKSHTCFVTSSRTCVRPFDRDRVGVDTLPYDISGV